MEARFSFKAGLLIRSAMVRAIRGFLFDEGADYTLDEDKGWFDSTYYLTIRGPESEVLAKSIQRWIKRIGKDE